MLWMVINIWMLQCGLKSQSFHYRRNVFCAMGRYLVDQPNNSCNAEPIDFINHKRSSLAAAPIA